MANINILDKSIFNRIAAGEVVEKPASVVKELVENSIDSGATNISIEIENGGISKIRVSDNGCGINKENLPKAFMPHATSKISTIKDLENIGTLGFRGEALSSICSVARVICTSKTKDENSGNRIVLENGEVKALTSVGCVDGTSVTVEDLFLNVPARLKFLRKPKLEESEITNLVLRLILANPNLIIKYEADKKTIFHSAGTGLKDAIYNVYGRDFLNNIMPYEATEENISLKGFIGKATFAKSNRTYQTLIINGRYVVNQQISTAVYKAYENYLMKGNFPVFILHLNIPLNKIDVNVHPNKLDVKFEDNSKIFALVLNSVSKALYISNNIKPLENLFKNTTESKIDLSNLQNLNEFDGKTFKTEDLNNAIVESSVIDSKTVNQVEAKEFQNIKASLADMLKTDKVKVASDNGFAFDLAKQAFNYNMFSENKDIKKEPESVIKIIGTAFNTYIIVQFNDNIYFIDQHAAHERVVYDKFNLELASHNIAIEQLLVPYILNVNNLEFEFINSNIGEFNKLGFFIESFGNNAYKISSVPLLLKHISLKNFFDEILKDIDSKVVLKRSTILKEYIAKKACRSAVKANDILSENEIKSLINELLSNKRILLCPHGRPIIIEICKTEIEKWFKRIV